MSDRKTFKLHIHTAERDFFNGECVSLIVPLASGQYGVMANHSDTVAAVVAGDLHITDAQGQVIDAICSAGMIKIEDNEVVVLVNRALTQEEVLVYEETRKAEEEIEKDILNRQTAEFNDAEAMLRRTIYKLKNKREIR